MRSTGYTRDKLTGIHIEPAFCVPLDIPNIDVDQVEIDRQESYWVTVQSTEHGTHCHPLGN
jgi:hypothetical protein